MYMPKTHYIFDEIICGKILNYFSNTTVSMTESHVDLLKTRYQQREYILCFHTYVQLYGSQYID